eukprot:Gb_21252 [translate_table: standard]
MERGTYFLYSGSGTSFRKRDTMTIVEVRLSNMELRKKVMDPTCQTKELEVITVRQNAWQISNSNKFSWETDLSMKRGLLSIIVHYMVNMDEIHCHVSKDQAPGIVDLITGTMIRMVVGKYAMASNVSNPMGSLRAIYVSRRAYRQFM